MYDYESIIEEVERAEEAASAELRALGCIEMAEIIERDVVELVADHDEFDAHLGWVS